MHRFRFSQLIILLFLIALLVACSGRGIGYGIVLWPPEESDLEAAMLVQVRSESSIEESYIITDSENGKNYSVKQWRIEFHQRKSDAEDAAARYRPYARQMALSREVGLPVRESPDVMSDRVYRLRNEEEMKILAKASDEVEVGSYMGYWYKVITRDGTVGYCFDHYLVIYEEGSRDEALAEESDDPRLDDFFERAYYPDRFLYLINQGTVDLETIRPDYGLFPDKEGQTVRIVSPKYQVEASYDEILPAGNNRYYFEGSSLYITFEDPRPPLNSLLVQFKVDASDVTARYTAIPDLEEILEEEQLRREEALDRIIEPGGTFQSSAYGTLTIDELGLFVWTGKERLVPSVLKASYGDRGTIRFDRHPAPELYAQYDGAASFRFAGTGKSDAVSFLYNLEPGGLRLTLVPEENVQDLVIQEVGYNPLVLFMSRQE